LEPVTIHYTRIWSGWLRLVHWLIAAGVLFLLASGWALQQLPADPDFWHDWHLIAGQLVALALLLRVVLLFVPGTSHWRALLPKRVQRMAMLQMLRFYLSLARAPLPAWHAHNPLWAPLYLLVLVVLAACIASGIWHGAPWRVFAIPLARWHTQLAGAVALFTLAHLVAVALHDWKGDGALISAMFSGRRYFHVRRPQPMEQSGTRSVEVTFSKQAD
jgi:Ni/Fe-hydrogenase 1 B-type cytochrome subunit